MRTGLITVFVCLFAVALAAPALASDGLDMLPPEAEGVLTITNLEAIYSRLGIEELREERPDDFHMLSEEMLEGVGIDLLDPAAMRAAGFEMDRPMHVGILADPPAVVVLVPGRDRALEWIQAKMEGLGVHFTRQKRYRGVTVDGGEADEVACFQRRGYIGVVVTDHEEGGGSAVETAGALIEGDGERSIVAVEMYRNTMERLPARADATFYMGPNLRTKLSSWGSSKRDLSEYGLSDEDMESWQRQLGIDEIASGMALRLAPDGMTVHAYSWLRKDSPARRWMVVGGDPVTFLRRTPSDPWLAAVTRLDAGALWDALAPFLDRVGEEDDETVRDAFEEVRAETGIDVEADVIRQLRGNLGLLVSRAAFVGTDVVLLAQVRNPERFGGTVDRVTALIREDIEKKASENPDSVRSQTTIREDTISGVKVHCVTVSPSAEIYYGIVEDHFVLASLRQRFGDIVGGQGSFVETLGSATVRDALAVPTGSAFYIDFRSLSRDAQAVLPMLGPKGVTVSQVLAELSELAVTSRIGDDGVTQVSTLSSTRPGIWKYMIGLLVSEAVRVQTD
jgi:hypothetical protein